MSRGQQVFAYNPEANLFDIAVAYVGGFVRNHPFIDGNKRAGFAAALVFLRANGFRLMQPSELAASKVVALAARELEEEALAAWLRANSVPFPG